MSVSGVVTSVSPDWRGSALAAATLATDTVLSVVDAADFDEDGGWLVVADVDTPVEYVAVDEDADTVTLAAAIGTAYEADEPVVVWDPTVEGGGARVREDIAEVMLPDAEQPVFAVVKHEQIPTAGVYSLVGATVVLEEEDDDETSDWYVLSVLGRVTVNGVQTSPAPQRGIEIDPSQNGGHGSLTAYDDQGQPTFNLNGQTGSVEMKGTLTSGSSIEGASLIGGAMSVAQTAAGAFDEAFSGTTFPAGWTNIKDKGTLADVKASVVASGPTGQDGSAILVDFGAAGAANTNLDAGEVATPITDVLNAEIRARFRVAATRSTVGDESRMEEVGIGIRMFDNWGSRPDDPTKSADGLVLKLIPDKVAENFWAFRLIRGTGFHIGSGATDLGVQPYYVGSDPTGKWMWAALRVDGGAAYLKVWADGDPEPAQWKAFTTDTLPTGAGRIAIPWEQNVGWSSGTSRGVQKVWIDSLSAETFDTGFQVLPDGSGSWPALGLYAGDTAWRVVGNTGAPAFTNGWTEFSNDSVKFRKFPTGDVTINADVNIPAGGHATSIFTLPTTHRPTVAYLNNFCWQNASVRLSGVSIRPDGTVSWENFNNTGGTRAIFSVTFSTL